MSTSNNYSNAQSSMPPRFQLQMPLFGRAPSFSFLTAPCK